MILQLTHVYRVGGVKRFILVIARALLSLQCRQLMLEVRYRVRDSMSLAGNLIRQAEQHTRRLMVVHDK